MSEDYLLQNGRVNRWGEEAGPLLVPHSKEVKMVIPESWQVDQYPDEDWFLKRGDEILTRDNIVERLTTLEQALRPCEKHDWGLLTPFGQTGAEWCRKCGARKQYDQIYLPTNLRKEVSPLS